MIIDDAICVAETKKAILVSAPDLDDEEWIPLSCVDDDSEVYSRGDQGMLKVSDWFARQRGWI